MMDDLHSRHTCIDAARAILRASDPRSEFALLCSRGLETGNVRGILTVLAIVRDLGRRIDDLYALFIEAVEAKARFPKGHHIDWLDGRIIDLAANYTETGNRTHRVQDFAPGLPLVRERASGAMHLMLALLQRSDIAESLAAASQADLIADAETRQQYEAYIDVTALDRANFFLGCHHCWSPFSGRLIRSTECVLLEGGTAHRLAVRFEDVEPFYLLHADAFMLVEAVVFPQRRAIVRLASTPMTDRTGATILDALSGIEGASQPKRQPDHRPATASMLLPHRNFGHHIWNGLGGILALSRIVSSVSVLDVSETPLPPVADLLREVSLDVIAGSAARDAISERRHIPLLFMDFLVDGRRIGPGGSHETEDGPKPVRIWIGIRGHNRRWKNVAECCNALVDARIRNGETVEVFVDGHTAPEAPADPPPAAIEELEWIGRIAERLGSKAKVTTLVWTGAEEKLSAARGVDFFVEVYGSGNAWNSWLRNKPGIYVAPSAVDPAARGIYALTPDAAPRHYLAQAAIAEDDPGSYNTDFSVDPGALAAASLNVWRAAEA